MKKFSKPEAPALIFLLFTFATCFIFLYEFWFTQFPSASIWAYKLGIFFSRLSYSVIAASIFYFVSQYIPVYLPKRRRKLGLLSIIYFRVLTIDSFVSELRNRLNINPGTFRDNKHFENCLLQISPTDSIDQYANWPQYFYYLRNEVLEIVRTLTQYEEYLSIAILEELIIIEDRLFSKNVFSGMNSSWGNDLTYALIPLQELLIHNDTIQKLREKEFAKYKKDFDKLGSEYRRKNFPETKS